MCCERKTYIYSTNMWRPLLCVCLMLEWNIKMNKGDFLVAHGLRIHLPMQGTWAPSLVWEDPTCHGAAKPVCQQFNPRSGCHMPQLLKPVNPGIPDSQQEKPPQWEALVPQTLKTRDQQPATKTDCSQINKIWTRCLCILKECLVKESEKSPVII